MEMSRRRTTTKAQTNGHHMRTQPRIIGTRRLPANTSLAKLLEEAIRTEMAAYNVSRSWVIASCCAYALGVEVPDYRQD